MVRWATTVAASIDDVATVQVSIRPSVHVLVQVVHGVGASAWDCVAQGVHGMRLRPVISAILMGDVLHCREVTRGVLLLLVLVMGVLLEVLGQRVERGRILQQLMVVVLD